ncbi:MAG: galactose-1-phosphate uridylyltransferase, partial [bacterium]|nr:galactose-1-phosphate uridylyltransferase [bacterium]
RNPAYTDTSVSDNDLASLLPDTPTGSFNDGDLMVAEADPGTCRVICFSPRHDLTLARMEPSAIRNVVDVWVDQYRELGAKPFINHVQIFENRGAMMGCSNPHPHCQIWSNSSIPNEPAKETATQRDYLAKHGSPLLADYSARELDSGDRIVVVNDHFVVLVPFWAVWPFETMILPRRQVSSIDEFTDDERNAFADALKGITTRYDNLFEISFPYSMGLHRSPTDGAEHPEWTFHVHFYPPLLRSATVKKFMVGYEFLACPQRDITAESAAERLRELSERHYADGQ